MSNRPAHASARRSVTAIPLISIVRVHVRGALVAHGAFAGLYQISRTCWQQFIARRCCCLPGAPACSPHPGWPPSSHLTASSIILVYLVMLGGTLYLTLATEELAIKIAFGLIAAALTS